MRKLCILLSAAIFTIALFGCVQSLAKGPVPGVDIPIDSGAFWDPDIIDYADDGNIYSQRQLASGQVYDHRRHVTNQPITIELITQKINTVTQIANQITNLAGLSPEAHLIHILGIESEAKEIINTVNQAQGLMKSAQKAEEAFSKTFSQVDSFFQGKTSDADRLANNKTMLGALDKTYQDALRTAKINANIEKDLELISETLNQNQAAAGNKQLKQTTGQVQAVKTLGQLKRAQNLSALASIIMARSEKEIQDEAFSAQKAFNELSLGVSDPYNPTENDLAFYERPKGKGFRHF